MKTMLSLAIASLVFGVTMIPRNARADTTAPEKPGVVMRQTGTVKTIEADTWADF